MSGTMKADETVNGQPEPPIGSRAIDETGHAWARGDDGWWRCEHVDEHPLVMWEWVDVLEDCTGGVRIERPGNAS